MKHVADTQVGHGIRLAAFVNEQREVDSGFFLENAGVVAIAEADGREGSTFGEEGWLMFTQLRDVLAAKNSSIVAKKNEHHRLPLPQRT